MAKIVFRPTCSRCLEILDNETIDIHYDEENISNSKLIHFTRNFSIEPERCPYCGEYFNGIIMPTSGKFPVKDSDLMSII